MFGVPASNLCGGVVEHGALEAHFLDHLAAAEERRHRGQVLAPRPQRAGAGRAAHLVAGEGVEVAADRGDVDRACAAAACEPSTTVTMPRLRASRQISRTGLTVPSTLETWVDAEQLHLRRHRRVQRVEVERAVGRDLGDLDRRAGALGDQLPRHDVGVVLHAREQDRVAGLAAAAAPTNTRPG